MDELCAACDLLEGVKDCDTCKQVFCTECFDVHDCLVEME